MIVVQSGQRLWAWDFQTRESLCWTDRIMVELKSKSMMVARRPDVQVPMPCFKPENQETDVNLRVMAGLANTEAKEYDNA